MDTLECRCSRARPSDEQLKAVAEEEKEKRIQALIADGLKGYKMPRALVVAKEKERLKEERRLRKERRRMPLD
jgi:hypothetical protein